MISFLNVLYIKLKEEKENKLYNLFKTAFCVIDIEEIFNGYIASVPLNKKKEVCKRNVNRINKGAVAFKNFISNKILQMKNCIIARKIRRIVNEKNIDGIVLSDEITENSEFVDKLILRKKQNQNLSNKFIKERKIFFFDGKGLFKYIIYEILVYIINIQNRKPELEDIYIIANTIDEIMLDNIIFLSTKFKNVNIVSKNIGKYAYIEELVYNNTGNNVILLNNKRKSLRRAKYIINVDNSIKELNEYLIYRKAIIINMQLEKKEQVNWKTSNQIDGGTNKKTSGQTIEQGKKSNTIFLTGFEGIFVNSFEIDLNNKIKQFFKKYGLINITKMSILYESFLNKKENFENIREKIEDAELMVTKLYGNNGIIDENEYKRVNISDNETKKYY